jgi:hypothetical protein
VPRSVSDAGGVTGEGEEASIVSSSGVDAERRG